MSGHYGELKSEPYCSEVSDTLTPNPFQVENGEDMQAAKRVKFQLLEKSLINPNKGTPTTNSRQEHYYQSDNWQMMIAYIFSLNTMSTFSKMARSSLKAVTTQ